MELIDNINKLLGNDLKASLKQGGKFQIAASCFSIYAWEALKDELSKIDALEFIFTAPTFTPNEATDKISKEHREFFIPKMDRERSLYGSDFEIQLRNKLNQRAIASECARWIRKKAIFKSNKTTAPMQQFACAHAKKGTSQADTKPDAVVYMPIRGFTAVDLGYQPGDAVSNIVNRIDETTFTTTYLQLFEQIWNDPAKLEDVTSIICNHIESVYQENSPEKIYFLMLYHIFKEFLNDINEDVLPNDRTGYQQTLVWKKLYNFQRDAVVGIINKLENYNGCILADSVGLGKTFTALAVVKYYELRNKSVLVLCPKKLADNWLNYNSNLTTNIFAQDRFNYDVLCHTDLSRTSGISLGLPLNKINWGNYDLLVIDESHNFRNNDAFKDRETRYQALMNKVIRQGVKTKVLMLSATPVNNRFADLRNQLALAYEGDSEQLSKKLKTTHSIEEIFRQAQIAFNQWSKLPPEERTAQSILQALDFDFFSLLDSVTIARSRKHIQTFYDMKDIGQFPKRKKPISCRCPLSALSEVPDFNAIYNQLSELKLAVYAPISYILPSRLAKYEELYDTTVEGKKGKLRQMDRERSLQALMTVNLLKRLESSVSSFRMTLQTLQKRHEHYLTLIEGYSGSSSSTVSDMTDAMERLEVDEDDIDFDGQDEIGSKVKIKLSDMDLLSWTHDLKIDFEIIKKLIQAMELVSPENDSKLQNLIRSIQEKQASPINPGNRKILVFTAFADTANYLYEQLIPHFQSRCHCARVTGKDAPKTTCGKGYDFQTILTLFSPRSKEKALVLPGNTDEIDILVATDCISEGQNLQDCDFLINYDIHWNPVRIIQRFGRIDRIGSINETIQLVNYWPDISLDEYIKLKERVENRMMIADVTATGDDNVLSPQSSDAAYRKEQLRRLQDEVIELEDLKTGVSITDLGLNDFRMDLLNYIKSHGDLELTPRGLHAVIPAAPEMGLEPGALFVLRNVNDKLKTNTHNLLHPFYLMYVNMDGDIIADYTAVKRLLDMIRASCRGKAEPFHDLCRDFNLATSDGRSMEHYSGLLGKAICSMVESKEEKDLDSLFSGGKTTALLNTISGLQDFELIAFLIIRE
jgi:SNF2 family DNA or RNA helicase